MYLYERSEGHPGQQSVHFHDSYPNRRLAPQFQFALSAGALGMYLYGSVRVLSHQVTCLNSKDVEKCC
jgi:hypothetical protein